MIGLIDTATFNELLQTINYINLNVLKESYSIPISDHQTATLKIKFTDGTTNTIRDYGLMGTIGLEHLYEQFFAMRTTQKWEKEKEEK